MFSITTEKRKRFVSTQKQTKADKNLYCVFIFRGPNINLFEKPIAIHKHHVNEKTAIFF